MSIDTRLIAKSKPCCSCLVNWQLTPCETMLTLVPIIGFVWGFLECISAENKGCDLHERQINYHFSKEMKNSYQNEGLLEEEVVEYKSFSEQERSAEIRQINLAWMMAINFAEICAASWALDYYVTHLVN